MWKFTGNQRPSFAIEPVDGQESVWDYPRPPVCVGDAREVVVRFEDTIVANSRATVRVLETASPPTFYIPQHDVNLDLLETASGSSFCEWKGAATYWNLHVNGQKIKNVGWSYEQPSQRFTSIQSFISFYPALLECWVDGERVRPQSGGFYGGWVTDEIVGPYKGQTGTGGW